MKYGWPVRVNNRIAYGLAACEFGGRTHSDMPAYSLSVADFTFTTRNQFWDHRVPTGDTLEPRPRAPLDILSWAEQAKIQTQVVCLTYGKEHGPGRYNCIEVFVAQNRAEPDIYTFWNVQAWWEELNFRFWEEIRVFYQKL